MTDEIVFERNQECSKNNGKVVQEKLTDLDKAGISTSFSIFYSPKFNTCMANIIIQFKGHMTRDTMDVFTRERYLSDDPNTGVQLYNKDTKQFEKISSYDE